MSLHIWYFPKASKKCIDAERRIYSKICSKEAFLKLQRYTCTYNANLNIFCECTSVLQIFDILNCTNKHSTSQSHDMGNTHLALKTWIDLWLSCTVYKGTPNYETRQFLYSLIRVSKLKQNDDMALQLKKRDEKMVYQIKNHVYMRTKSKGM